MVKEHNIWIASHLTWICALLLHFNTSRVTSRITGSAGYSPAEHLTLYPAKSEKIREKAFFFKSNAVVWLFKEVEHPVLWLLIMTDVICTRHLSEWKSTGCQLFIHLSSNKVMFLLLPRLIFFLQYSLISWYSLFHGMIWLNANNVLRDSYHPELMPGNIFFFKAAQKQKLGRTVIIWMQNLVDIVLMEHEKYVTAEQPHNSRIPFISFHLMRLLVKLNSQQLF